MEGRTALPDMPNLPKSQLRQMIHARLCDYDVGSDNSPVLGYKLDETMPEMVNDDAVVHLAMIDAVSLVPERAPVLPPDALDCLMRRVMSNGFATRERY
jgi:hypothetical protein